MRHLVANQLRSGFTFFVRSTMIIAVVLVLAACDGSGGKSGSGGSAFTGFQALFIQPVRDAVISSVGAVDTGNSVNNVPSYSLVTNRNEPASLAALGVAPAAVSQSPLSFQGKAVPDLNKSNFSNCPELNPSGSKPDFYNLSRWLEFQKPSTLPADSDHTADKADIFSLHFEYKFYFSYLYYCFAKKDYDTSVTGAYSKTAYKVNDTTDDKYAETKITIGRGSAHKITNKTSDTTYLLNFLDLGEVDMVKRKSITKAYNSMDYAQKMYQFSSPIENNKQKLTAVSTYYMFDFSVDTVNKATNKQAHQVHTFVGTNKSATAVYLATATLRDWYDPACNYEKTKEKSGGSFYPELGLFVDPTGDMAGGNGQPGYGCFNSPQSGEPAAIYANTIETSHTLPDKAQYFYTIAVIKPDSYGLYFCESNPNTSKCNTSENWTEEKHYPRASVEKTNFTVLHAKFMSAFSDSSKLNEDIRHTATGSGTVTFRDKIMGTDASGSKISIKGMWNFLEDS